MNLNKFDINGLHINGLRLASSVLGGTLATSKSTRKLWQLTSNLYTPPINHQMPLLIKRTHVCRTCGYAKGRSHLCQRKHGEHNRVDRCKYWIPRNLIGTLRREGHTPINEWNR